MVLKGIDDLLDEGIRYIIWIDFLFEIETRRNERNKEFIDQRTQSLLDCLVQNLLVWESFENGIHLVGAIIFFIFSATNARWNSFDADLS